MGAFLNFLYIYINEVLLPTPPHPWRARGISPGGLYITVAPTWPIQPNIAAMAQLMLASVHSTSGVRELTYSAL